MNPFAVVGSLLALLAFALAAVQAGLKDFVHVFLLTDEQDPGGSKLTDSCQIAHLGVYSTSYDPSCLSAYTLKASHVPTEAFTEPTTTFRLLFPAQENFVAQILPVTSENLPTFDALIATQQNPHPATDLFKPTVDAIENQKFDNCKQYMTETEANLDTLFSKLNDQFLPGVVPLVVGPGVLTLSTGIGQFEAALQGTPDVNPFTGMMFNTYLSIVGPAASASCGTPVPPSVNDTLTAGQYTCLAAVYGQVAASANVQAQPALEQLVAGMQNLMTACSSAATGAGGALPVQNCFGGVQTSMLDNGFVTAATFTGAPQQVFGSVCNFWPMCGSGQLKFQVLGTLSTLVGELLVASPTNSQLILLQQGVGAYLLTFQYLQTVISPPATSAQFTATLNSILATSSFPATFTEFYPPCALLQINEQANGANFPNTPNEPGNCTFANFFPAAGEFATAAGLPIGDVMDELSELYGICQQFHLDPPNCDLLFPSLFINGAYSNELDPLAFFQNVSGVFFEAVDACDDDVIDNKKISGAQVLLSFSLFLYSLTLVMAVASIFITNGVVPLMAVTAFVTVLAGGTNIGALLVVKSAPVYDSVGPPENPKAFDSVYEVGIVQTLALVTVLLCVLNAVCMTVGACMISRKPSAAPAEVDAPKEPATPAEDAKVAAVAAGAAAAMEATL